jgi:hypothetical protein
VPLTVTGTATSASNGRVHTLLLRGSQHYAAYVQQQATLLVEHARTLAAVTGLAQAVQAVAEPLPRVASRVVHA